MYCKIPAAVVAGILPYLYGKILNIVIITNIRS